MATDTEFETATKQFEPEADECAVTVYETGIARFNQPAQDHLDAGHVLIQVEKLGDQVRFKPTSDQNEDAYSIAKDSGAVSMAGPLTLMGKEKPDDPVSVPLHAVEDDASALGGSFEEIPNSGESS